MYPGPSLKGRGEGGEAEGLHYGCWGDGRPWLNRPSCRSGIPTASFKDVIDFLCFERR